MLYLLGGAARTGKTTIAQTFLSKTSIPFFSLDFLMMGFADGMPEFGLDPDADELLVAEQLWPVVGAMLSAMVEDEVDYLVEGVQLHPKHAWELCEKFAGRVRVCFVGFAKVDTLVKLEEIRRFGGGADDWMRHYPDEQVIQEIERLKNLSVRLEDACQQYGIKYVEASDDLSDTVADVMRYFTG